MELRVKKAFKMFGSLQKRSYLCTAFERKRSHGNVYKALQVWLKCGNSSVGRAQPCQGWGRGSESRFPLDKIVTKESIEGISSN